MRWRSSSAYLRSAGSIFAFDDDDDDGNAEDWDLELWQELERDPAVRQRLRETLEEEERGYTNTRTAPEDEHPPAAEDEGAGLGFFGRVV